MESLLDGQYHQIIYFCFYDLVRDIWTGPHDAEDLLYSINFDSELAEMFLIPHILVRFLGLSQRKSLFVHHRLDPGGLNRPVHSLKLEPTSNQNTSNRTNVGQAFQETRLVFAHTPQETDDVDHSVNLDGLEGLSESVWSANFNDVVDTEFVRGKCLGGLTPFLVGLVV